VVLNATNPDVSPNIKVVKQAIEKAFSQTLTTADFSQKEIDRTIEKVTGTAVDSVVQYAAYEPVLTEDLDINKVEEDIYSAILSGLKEITLPAEKEEAMKVLINNGASSAYEVIVREKLNLRYDYYYDILIFVTLAILSVVVAFLLKMEDRRKGYGLELPNIEKKEE
jgi:hypothetical protein